MLLNISDEDWRMYYDNSYCSIPKRINGVNVLIPFFIEGSSWADDGEDESDRVFHGSILRVSSDGSMSWDGEHAYLIRDCIDLTFPECGYVNLSETAIYMDKKAVRQWHRGMTAAQVNVYQPNMKEWNTLGKPSIRLHNHELVFGLFNRNYPTYQQAFDSVVLGKTMACAFDTEFAFVIKSGVSRPLLMYRDNVCGYADPLRGVIIHPVFKHLEKELSVYTEVVYAES